MRLFFIQLFFSLLFSSFFPITLVGLNAQSTQTLKDEEIKGNLKNTLSLCLTINRKYLTLSITH